MARNDHKKSFIHHTGQAAIENAKTIEERRSKISRKSVFDCHLSPTGDKWHWKTLFLISIFYPRSSIVDYFFDCHLPGVVTEPNYSSANIIVRDQLALTRLFPYLFAFFAAKNSLL